MRKFLTLIASLAIVSSFLIASPAAASGNRGCLDSNPENYHAGDTYNPSTSIVGVYATIDFHWDNCDGTGDDDSGIAAWVALAPDDALIGDLIVQVGIISCRSNWTPQASVCRDHPNQLRYFFAYGGCTFLTGPWARDGGPATSGVHNYKVTRATEGFYMWMPNGTTAFIAASDPSVSCITSGVQTKAQFDVERFDRGDSMGGPTTKTAFGEMQYKLNGGSTYIHLNWGSSAGPCTQVDSTSPHNAACYDVGDNMFDWDD